MAHLTSGRPPAGGRCDIDLGRPELKNPVREAGLFDGRARRGSGSRSHFPSVDAGAQDGIATAFLEEQVGPQGRRAFEDFLRKIERLEVERR